MRWSWIWICLACAPAGAMDTRPIKRAPAAQESLPPQPEVQDGTVPVEVTDGPPEAVGTRSSVPMGVGADAEAAASTDAIATTRDWVITGNYSYPDLWVPNKLGATVSHRVNEKSWIEFDYMRGTFSTGWIGLDLGRIVEQRAVIQWRRFPWAKSFNYFVGANYNDLVLTIDEALIFSTIPSATSASDYEAIALSSLGLSGGIGHRWVIGPGFVLAVDWLHVHLPVISLRQNAPFRDATNDPDRRNETDKFLNYVQNLPRFAAIKLQFGWSF